MTSTSLVNDTSQYKMHIETSLCFIVEIYINILNEYLLLLIKKIKMKNMQFYYFIFNRGLQTITHVFMLLLIHTKNIILVSNECNKALFYYLEFIEQISDEEHNFIHLSSLEATLFVYKKTIYEINNEHRKKNSNNLSTEDLKKTDSMNIIIEKVAVYYKNILKDFLDKKINYEEIQSAKLIELKKTILSMEIVNAN